LLKNDDVHLPITKPCPAQPPGDGIGGDGGGGGLAPLWIAAIFAAAMALLVVAGVGIFFAVKFVRSRAWGFTMLGGSTPSAQTLEEEEEDGSLESVDNKL